MNIEVPIVAVHDKNVYNMLDNKGSSDNMIDHTELNDITTDNKIMFPTKIRYIFEDDERNNLVKNDEKENNSDIENVILIDLDSSNYLENVMLLSDKFELLSFKENKTQQLNNIGNNGEFSNLRNAIELNVVSQFRDLSNVTNDLSLSELIKIYAIQNQQIETLFNSI